MRHHAQVELARLSRRKIKCEIEVAQVGIAGAEARAVAGLMFADTTVGIDAEQGDVVEQCVLDDQQPSFPASFEILCGETKPECAVDIPEVGTPDRQRLEFTGSGTRADRVEVKLAAGIVQARGDRRELNQILIRTETSGASGCP